MKHDKYQDSHNFNMSEMTSIKSPDMDVSKMSCTGDISVLKMVKNICAAIYITLDVEQSSSVAKYLSVVTNAVSMISLTLHFSILYHILPVTKFDRQMFTCSHECGDPTTRYLDLTPLSSHRFSITFRYHTIPFHII